MDDIAYQCQQLPQRHPENTQQMVNDYDTVLRTVLEGHAPSTNRVRRRARPRVWYTNNVKEAREKERQCEHRWRTTKLEVHRQLYVESRNASTASITKAKCKHYQDTLQGADNQSMFRLVRSLRAIQKAIYPEFCSTENGCSKFAQHFSENVRMIRVELEVPHSPNPPLVEKNMLSQHIRNCAFTTHQKLFDAFYFHIHHISQINKFLPIINCKAGDASFPCSSSRPVEQTTFFSTRTTQ